MDTIITAAAARRQRLAKKIGNGVVILTAAAPAPRSRDTTYFPYRHDSYLYYLSGCREPHTALVFTAQNGAISNEYFFCQPYDAHAARWEGKRLSPKSAKRQLGIDDCGDIAALPARLADIAAKHDTLFYAPGLDENVDTLIQNLSRARRANNRSNRKFPAILTDVTALLDNMRLIKDDCEIHLLRQACRLTASGIMAAMRAAANAKYEYEVEAQIIAAYRQGGGEHAFAPIVAGGSNACVLHYTQNNARLQKKKGLLVDSGCELDGYAGDITRSFPINGDWQGGFAAVYKVVLAAQKSALRAAKPGATLLQIENAAVRKLAAGLRDLKLCRGSVESIISRQLYKRFYMHSIGHWLGLDVHDAGSTYDSDNKPLRLRPGMVLTIEPGLYIPAAADIPPALGGIGIRIEDDILITKNGHDILTHDVPKTPPDIRAWMRDS